MISAHNSEQLSPRIGCWCRVESPFAIDAVAASGFDWLCLDLQHGLASHGDVFALARQLAVTSTEFYVRVPWNDPSAIMKALDAGVHGVIVPMVENATEVELAVSAARYPPLGARSSAGLGRGGANPAEANALVKCGAMIETAAAVNDLDNILSVSGLDFVLVGPEDLSLSLGLNASDEAVVRAREEIFGEIADACVRHEVTAGIFCGDVASTIAWARRGYRFLALATDLALLAQAATAAVRDVRTELMGRP
jgi:4-hydroxy-2-oxoheptanedioate aldolase